MTSDQRFRDPFSTLNDFPSPGGDEVLLGVELCHTGDLDRQGVDGVILNIKCLVFDQFQVGTVLPDDDESVVAPRVDLLGLRGTQTVDGTFVCLQVRTLEVDFELQHRGVLVDLSPDVELALSIKRYLRSCR